MKLNVYTEITRIDDSSVAVRDKIKTCAVETLFF